MQTEEFLREIFGNPAEDYPELPTTEEMIEEQFDPDQMFRALGMSQK